VFTLFHMSYGMYISPDHDSSELQGFSYF
jgi:hypothetical protein